MDEKKLDSKDMPHLCETCKHYDGGTGQTLKRDIPEPCRGCCPVDDHWDWCGPQETKKGKTK